MIRTALHPVNSESLVSAIQATNLPLSKPSRMYGSERFLHRVEGGRIRITGVVKHGPSLPQDFWQIVDACLSYSDFEHLQSCWDYLRNTNTRLVFRKSQLSINEAHFASRCCSVLKAIHSVFQ